MPCKIPILGQQISNSLARPHRLSPQHLTHQRMRRLQISLLNTLPPRPRHLKERLWLTAQIIRPVLSHILVARDEFKLDLSTGRLVDHVDDLRRPDGLLCGEEHDFVVVAAGDHEAGGGFAELVAERESHGGVGRQGDCLCCGKPVYKDGEGVGVDAFADRGVCQAGSVRIRV